MQLSCTLCTPHLPFPAHKRSAGHIREMAQKDTDNYNCNSCSHLIYIDVSSKYHPRQIFFLRTTLLCSHYIHLSSDYCPYYRGAGLWLPFVVSPKLAQWSLTWVININYCKGSCLVLLVRTSVWRVIDGFRLASCQEGSIVFICDTLERK